MSGTHLRNFEFRPICTLEFFDRDGEVTNIAAGKPLNAVLSARRVRRMSWILILVVIVVALVVFVALKGKQRAGGSVGFPYQPEETLFTVAERSFLCVLDQVVGPECRVFGKVRVADIAKVKSGLGNSARQAALNRVAAKHFDFVVCRASDLAVLCAVELNDKSHATKRAKARDQLIENVCKAIDLPLLQFAAKATYSHQDVRSRFHAAIGSAMSGESV